MSAFLDRQQRKLAEKAAELDADINDLVKLLRDAKDEVRGRQRFTVLLES